MRQWFVHQAHVEMTIVELGNNVMSRCLSRTQGEETEANLVINTMRTGWIR